MINKPVVWFSEIRSKDNDLVGGKGLNLGLMYNLKLPVPPGFVITTHTYKFFLEKNKLKSKINSVLKNLDVEDTEKLQEASDKVQELILDASMPEIIKKTIVESYEDLNVDRAVTKALGDKSSALGGFIKAGRDLPFVAVRSSANAEDQIEASFAGQQATYLNVRGKDEIVLAVQKCWASLFTARAIYYRAKNNVQTEKVFIAVVVQKMVNSEISGIMFSANPATNNENEIVIEAGFGLGETVVGGEITPDTYIIDKNNLKIKSKKIARQEYGLFKDQYTGRNIKKDLSEAEGSKQKLNEKDIIGLAKYAKVLEEHYKKPMDSEWAVEGGKIYLVQTRPITTLLKKRAEAPKIEDKNMKEILRGLGASPGVGVGKVKIVQDLKELSKVQKGDVLVTRMTSPDYVVSMRKAVAIVTDEGSLTSHASIVSRELGIPAVVGTEKATQLLHENDLITVDGTSGVVYEGSVLRVAKKEEKISVEEVKGLNTKTKIYMNLGEPDKIDDYKDLPFDGIGLMRIEFIITDKIGKHPLYMIEHGQEQEYINKLAEGISKVAKTIYPRLIIVRFSDFKTNEYKNLEGGEKFEPKEENPMIGFRGCSRYISEEFREAFKLEIKAIKNVRKEFNNVHVMLPFVRNTNDVEKCLEILKSEGLENSEEFRIYIMAEVPSIAFVPDDFAKLNIYGASIGSNDLTQMTLGVDRDSAKLGKMGYFDERNPAVLKAMSNIIKRFKKNGKTVGICGQAPSEYKEIVEFLVKEGIDSISVNPDVVSKTRKLVYDVEIMLRYNPLEE